MYPIRFLLRGFKIVPRNIWGYVTSYYTRLYFRANGAELGRKLTSLGVPELELSIKGRFSVGSDMILQNGAHYNMIGRQQKCYFVIGRRAWLSIGDNVGMSGTAIVCHERVTIGDHVRIGMNTVIYDTDFHDLDHRKRTVVPEVTEGIVKKPVHIGNYVFIGAHTTILKGVTIGDRSIIGAGSVVTRQVPPGEIWAGNPARFIAAVPKNASWQAYSVLAAQPVTQ